MRVAEQCEAIHHGIKAVGNNATLFTPLGARAMLKYADQYPKLAPNLLTLAFIDDDNLDGCYSSVSHSHWNFVPGSLSYHQRPFSTFNRKFHLDTIEQVGKIIMINENINASCTFATHNPAKEALFMLYEIAMGRYNTHPLHSFFVHLSPQFKADDIFSRILLQANQTIGHQYTPLINSLDPLREDFQIIALALINAQDSEEQISETLEAVYPKINKNGGWIVFNNYNPDSTAINQFLDSCTETHAIHRIKEMFFIQILANYEF